MTPSRLLAVLAAGLAFSLPVSAKMYKWVDDQGVTHYGETIPPEYADKDRSELNKAGRVVKKKEMLTVEEKLEKEKSAKEKLADETSEKEQKRRDKALVNTYSNSDEIELARNRNLQQVNARIGSIHSQIKIVEGNLAALKKEADGYQASGRKAPASLQDDLGQSQNRLGRLHQDLEKANAEKAALNARYDADKARYKELTGR